MLTKDLIQLDLLTMQDDLMAHLANVAYVIEGGEAGEAKKPLVSLEHKLSDALALIDQILLLERKTV
jgi:hypothetical protein